MTPWASTIPPTPPPSWYLLRFSFTSESFSKASFSSRYFRSGATACRHKSSAPAKRDFSPAPHSLPSPQHIHSTYLIILNRVRRQTDVLYILPDVCHHLREGWCSEQQWRLKNSPYIRTVPGPTPLPTLEVRCAVTVWASR